MNTNMTVRPFFLILLAIVLVASFFAVPGCQDCRDMKRRCKSNGSHGYAQRELQDRQHCK